MKSYLSTIKDYIVFFIALIACIISINGWSLWMDESSTAFFAQLPDIGSFVKTISNWNGSESQMPCYVFTEFLWAKLFGSSEYALRAINLLFIILYLLYFLWLYKRKDIEGTDKRKIQIFVLLTSISPFILYNMSCHEKYQELNEEQKEKILRFAYDFYLKDESCIDVGKIVDTIMENYEGILNGELDKTNIYCLIDY